MPLRIAIIGGGAAGMMTAATLCERDDLDAEIHLFEKNSKLGAKVIISGGGRCNVTTGFFKLQELLPKYPRGAAFLTPALEQFGPRAIKRRFESHGVPLKQEEDGRIFPVSDDGKDIVGALEHVLSVGGVHVHLKEGVKEINPSVSFVDISPQEGRSTSTDTHFTVTTDQGRYIFDRVVLTTGGNAYAHTGSSGDGYAWARACGHTITPLGPSLNSFLTAQERLHPCSGISFSDAIVRSGDNGTRGPVLLTHFGISGPAVFAFSSHIPYVSIDKEHGYTVWLQPHAAFGQEQRTSWFLEQTTITPKKEIATSLRQFFTKKFVETLFIHHEYALHMTFGSCTKEQRKTIAQLLGVGIPLTLIQRRPGDEFVTAGGVSLEEVDPKSGQSRLSPGLSFAGEILDVDGYTGGYNLTASWAMGRLVGKAIVP